MLIEIAISLVWSLTLGAHHQVPTKRSETISGCAAAAVALLASTIPIPPTACSLLFCIMPLLLHAMRPANNTSTAVMMQSLEYENGTQLF